MKEINVSEATGPVLDWLVAKCEGIPVARHSTGAIFLIDTPWADKSRVKWLAEYSPSKHWAQGGPIIERENINIVREGYAADWIASLYDDVDSDWHLHTHGPTPLIAAMRCYVASKLGDIVEVPEELLNGD